MFMHCRQRLKGHDRIGGTQRRKSGNNDRSAAAQDTVGFSGASKKRLLLWISNLWSFGEGMLGPLFAVFAQHVGGNVLDITWAWAI
jgi:hypothetical protein